MVQDAMLQLLINLGVCGRNVAHVCLKKLFPLSAATERQNNTDRHEALNTLNNTIPHEVLNNTIPHEDLNNTNPHDVTHNF